MTSIRYQVGGALLQDVLSYVTRDSDHQLLEALKAGEFCYVLNSRQMGKSSLMVRTLAQLQESGWKGIILDFSAKDTQSDQPSFWYNGIINQLNNHFKLLDRGDFRTWLKERDFISPVERLGEFIETVLLLGIIEPIVIFVDEIDSTLGLPFTDDFFALIRACYNRRAEKPDYQRLTFALLGVAAPSELIGDTKRTPFNIGTSIDLSGFTLAEAQPLAAGLAEKSEDPQAVLKAILYWTGGQPFLSQRLCQLVADANDHITAGSEASFVEGLVRSRLIENWESQDQQSHLKTIRDRVIKNEQKAGYLLELYRQTRQAGSLPVQNRPEEQELQLSGLVVKREGKLQVYNPIYGEVFNELWIDGELAKLRPYSDSFRAWIVSGRTDNSRLLRGGALKEAEQWAKEKNPSAEDQDFISASRTQGREEEIAAKEREMELEREKKGREAAEAAELIQAEANRQAKNRIRIGSIILGFTLLGTAICGVWGFQEGQKATKQLAIAKDAEEKAQQQELKFQSTNENLNKLNQRFESVEKQRKTAEIKYKDAQMQVEQAQVKLTSAQNQQRKAQSAAQNARAISLRAQSQKIQAQNQLFQAKTNLQTAEREKIIAQTAAQQAKAEKQRADLEYVNINTEIQTAQNLVQLAGELQDKDKSDASNEALRQAGLSFKVVNHNLKQSLLLAATSQAYQSLEKWNEAKDKSQASLTILERVKNMNSSSEGLQIFVFVKTTEGNLLKKQEDYTKAKEAYQKAFYMLQNHRQEFYIFPNYSKDNDPFAFLKIQIIGAETIESLHWGLINLLADQSNQQQFKNEVKKSLKQHYLAELNLLLKKQRWKEADEKTRRLMLFIASREQQGWLNIQAQEEFPCDDLRTIDKSWIAHSQGHFGFSVQKKVLESLGWKLGDLTEKTMIEFYKRVGWAQEKEGRIVWEEIKYKKGLESQTGYLPSGNPTVEENVRIGLLSHCKL